MVCDPFVYGRPRFLAEPLIFPKLFVAEMYDVSRRIGALYDELAQVVWDAPEVLDSFYALTRFQRAMWLGSAGMWHGFARLDVFDCDGGFVMCEINADTPSGQSDIVACSRVLAPKVDCASDPNGEYGTMLCDLIEKWFAAQVEDRPPRRVGIIYPTDLPEDMALIQLYSEWFRARGWDVVLGSPYNVERRRDGGISLMGAPVDVVMRHYKTDWWGERIQGRTDEGPYLDPDPLDEAIWLMDAERAGKLLVINPFGSMMAQDKRSMAFFWEEFDRFSVESQESIRRFVPETRLLRTVGKEAAKSQQSEWVLKSDFGCEGEEVFVGAHVSEADWAGEIDGAIEDRWILQRRFMPKDVEGRGVANYGVYLIGGEPAGLYVRLAPADEPTGHGAVVATPFVTRE
ncbi:MAG: glutathionylspermidine synthase [Bradymonadia bacterium]